MKFSELSMGQQATIQSIATGDPAYRHKLMAMGLLPGTPFTVTRIAPLGDPIEITIRGFALSLRRQEADLLELSPVPSHG
ncbi:MAG TPA: ferrous iron transport protein A [Gammaproteobacteria bacterium]|jgi:ferrous iron transport protein A|nr:ferrous iron transport protein A [Gammaproteobacteria bacterium]